MTATPKQVSYALALLASAGYSTTYMNAGYKRLNVPLRQRTGTVQAWLEAMPRHEISALIGELAARP